MGDARAIYAQFASTPLKIRAAATKAASASDDVAPTPAATVAIVDDDSTALETGACTCSPPPAAALVSPSGPSPPSIVATSTEATDDSGEQPATTATSRKRKRSSGAASDALPPPVVPGAATRRSKRVTSAAQALKAVRDDQLQTPPEDVRPAKRSRKATTKSPSAAKQQRQLSSSAGGVAATEDAGESRALLSAFALCDGDDDTEEEKAEKELPTPPKLVIPAKKSKRRSLLPTRRRERSAAARSARDRDAPQSPVKTKAPTDFITDACDALLETRTISGALFAAALNSLRSLQDELALAQPRGADDSRAPPNPFATVCQIAARIAQCEQLAESHSRASAKPQSVLSRRRGLKAPGAKKSVRFRSFDLSCIDLQYVRNAQAEGAVDTILDSYDTIMSQLARVRQSGVERSESEPPATPTRLDARVLREFARTLSDTAVLSVDPDTLPTEAERIHLAAFGSRDPQAQHELQASREFYATEFQKLVQPDSGDAPPSSAFLEELFSSLVSSSVRFKLRALFLEYDAGENAPTVSMAAYAHQDFGSAVHCALQEALLYRPLAEPALALVGDKLQLMEHLKTVEMADFEHIEQFALARRFLGHHLKRALEAPSSDGYTTRTWAKVERICGVARRHRFDDEAHLFPLESVKDFVATLEEEEADLARLETTLGEFYDQQKEEHDSKLSPQPCSECGERVTRLESSGFIVCTQCAGNFHLKCLHLPPSFTQFAGQYTCPSCFLGRR